MTGFRWAAGVITAAVLACAGCGEADAVTTPSRGKLANVYLTVYCRHPESDACDRVVIDVQGLERPARRVAVSVLDHRVDLRQLGGHRDRSEARRRSGRFWRGRLPDAGLSEAPVSYDPSDLQERRRHAPVPVTVEVTADDGSTQETSQVVSIVLPDLSIAYDRRREGYRASVPFGWQRAERSLTPHLADPVEIFTAATFRPRRGGPCAQMPYRAARQARDMKGALVSIQERTGAPMSENRASEKGFPARPRPFTPDPGRFECISTRGVAASFVPFWDRGRRFYAVIVIADAAPDRVRREALTILDDIHFDRSAPPGALNKREFVERTSLCFTRRNVLLSGGERLPAVRDGDLPRSQLPGIARATVIPGTRHVLRDAANKRVAGWLERRVDEIAAAARRGLAELRENPRLLLGGRVPGFQDANRLASGWGLENC